MNAAPSIVARLAGAVLLAFGTGVAVLVIWIIERQWSMYATVKIEAAALIAGLGVVATFTSIVGYRLTFNRPNQHGSMLSPRAWIILAVFFAGLGAAVVAGGLAQGQLEALATVPFSALLVVGCILARRRAVHSGRNGRAL